MTRRYFTLLFILSLAAVFIALDYFFPQFDISRYIVIWVLGAFYIGQYSARYPKG